MSTPLADRWTGPPSKAWRLSTATRVFVLALAAGLTLSAGNVGSTGMILLSLAVLAALACAVELDPLVETARWTPVIEGGLVAILLTTTSAPAESLLAYLAVPAVVGGIRHGAVSSLNAALATFVALLGGWVTAQKFELPTASLALSIPWLFVGIGTGLLAAWLGRSTRALENAQAPYAAAHRLLAQLHAVSMCLSDDLDSRGVAQQMVDDLWRLSGAPRAALVIRSPRGELLRLAGVGASGPAEDQLTEQCITERLPLRAGKYLVLPLQVGDHTFGAVVICGADPIDAPTETRLLQYLNEQSLRLDTSLLFEEVRAVATTEERNRVAREIHDGVAQEVASLGYLIDEVADRLGVVGPDCVAELRGEVTRIVGELRLSIFDLRHGVSEAGGLAGAVADYAREVGARADLRVHLLLDEQGLQLAPHVESELLRVAQEALGNVRKHARARNLWVSLMNDAGGITLTVEDDGTGAAVPRSGHYGLRNMAERAALIGADFAIHPRRGGGTVVTVQLTSTGSVGGEPMEGTSHEHTNPAHR